MRTLIFSMMDPLARRVLQNEAQRHKGNLSRPRRRRARIQKRADIDPWQVRRAEYLKNAGRTEA